MPGLFRNRATGKMHDMPKQPAWGSAEANAAHAAANPKPHPGLDIAHADGTPRRDWNGNALVRKPPPGPPKW